MRTLGIAILALALAHAHALPAGAVPFVYVSTTATAAVLGNPPDAETSDASGTAAAATAANAVLSAPITTTSNFLVGAAAAGMARLGILAADAAADLQSTHSGTLTFLNDGLAGGSATVSAGFAIDDLVVTATGTGGPATVPIALRLDLSGSLAASGSLNQPPELGWPAGAGGTASLAVGVTVGAIGIQTFTGARSYSNNDRNEESSGASGLLAGGDSLVTPVFDVVVGAPFRLEVRLDVAAGASTNITHGNADATASYGTLRFATGPVFDLPPGFTVSSESAGIVDNHFVVPEPSTFALVWLGGVFLARARRGAGRAT
jgi:hypothetical protein